MAIVRNWQQAALATLFVTGVCGLVLIALVKSRSVPEDSIYVGSATFFIINASDFVPTIVENTLALHEAARNALADLLFDIDQRFRNCLAN